MTGMMEAASDDARRATPPGRVIFLNGASSAGKSTLARELQRVLPDLYLHLALDTFLRQLPEGGLANRPLLVQLLSQLVEGFHRSCAAIARAGLHIVVDTVLEEPAWVKPCVQAFSGLEVLFVGLRCGLATLEERERARGDRYLGTARYQVDRIHLHNLYDVEVDTEAASPENCAIRIREHMAGGTPSSAFTRLRREPGR